MSAPVAATAHSPKARSARAKPGYTTGVASFDRDTPAIVGLWDRGLTREGRAESKLQWYYRRNPEGLPQALFLRCDGAAREVGVASMAPRRMQLGARSLVAGCLVDFVVEPEHRNFFPALLLQRNMLAHARAGHAVVYGTPNPQSEAVVKRAGYRCIGHLVRRVRVLRSSVYLSRFLPEWLSRGVGAAIDGAMQAKAALAALGDSGFACEWRDRPGEDFDALWERVARSGVLIGVRDRAFLTWRFVDGPLDKHRFFVVRAKADRRLLGYAVCHVRANATEVADFLVDPAVPNAGRRLFLELAREAYRAGHRSLSVEFLGAEAVRRQLDAFGTVHRGKRPFYAAWDDGLDLSRASQWYVTNADEDG